MSLKLKLLETAIMEMYWMFRLKKEKQKNMFLAYVGTISHWFDFDILLKSLKDFKNIEYRFDRTSKWSYNSRK